VQESAALHSVIQVLLWLVSQRGLTSDGNSNLMLGLHALRKKKKNRTFVTRQASVQLTAAFLITYIALNLSTRWLVIPIDLTAAKPCLETAAKGRLWAEERREKGVFWNFLFKWHQAFGFLHLTTKKKKQPLRFEILCRQVSMLTDDARCNRNEQLVEANFCRGSSWMKNGEHAFSTYPTTRQP
jgi:hypothetical protein